jgi:tRNA dimethylallyltransferase
LEAAPFDELLDELKAKDPAAFESLDRKNRRRVVRAVEVIRLTGQPYSSQRTGWGAPGQAPSNLFCITREPDDLAKRIHARVDSMFERGLVAETEHLAKRGLRENRTACQALGYRQVLEHLDGEFGLAETIELVKARTRQFAKRQRTWFRNQMECQPFECAAGELADGCCERLLGMLG